MAQPDGRRRAVADLTVGLLGAGVMAGVHLRAWQGLGARIVVHSLHGALELAQRDATGRTTAVGSLEELLARADVVDICTPTDTHAELAVAAAEAGKPILCEKPLAVEVPDAERMLQAAAAAGVALYPGHVVRYFPEYEVLAREVAAGRVGPLAVLRFTRTGAYPTRSAWFSEPRRSGGVLTDQMVHDFDLARLIAGAVVRVHARELTRAVPPARPGDVAAATAVLTHAGGAITHVRGVWGPPGTAFRTSYRVAGPGGVIEHDSAHTRAFHLVSAPGDEGVMPDVGLVESPYDREVREMAEAFCGGPSPRVDGSDGLAAVAIAAAARQSATTGEVVEVRAPAGSLPEAGGEGVGA